jgi:hypothetical protein
MPDPSPPPIPRIKAPRTWHLPFSPDAGHAADDLVLPDCRSFAGREVVVLEKLDGENTTIYPDGYVHACAIAGRADPTQAWVRGWAARWAWALPPGHRASVENLREQHTLYYPVDRFVLEHQPPAPPHPVYAFLWALWDGAHALAWDEIVAWTARLETATATRLPLAPVLYRGLWDEARIATLLPPRRSSTWKDLSCA